MRDLISRQAAIDAIERDAYRHTYLDQILDIIKSMPSVQPEIRYYGQFEIKDPILISEQRWIPCSERLPEAKGHKPYLITEAHYDPECIGRFVEIDWYDARDDERVPSWDDHEEKDGIRVVAWMPLPEAYKGEKE